MTGCLAYRAGDAATMEEDKRVSLLDAIEGRELLHVHLV